MRTATRSGMHAKGLLSVCLLIFGTIYYRQCGAQTDDPLSFVFAAELDLSHNSTIAATAECGRNESGHPVAMEFCVARNRCQTCESGDYPAYASIDGDEATSWQSPPGEVGSVNLTLELGLLFRVSTVTVHSGASPLPTEWTLHLSQDGISFDPFLFFVSDPVDCLSSGDSPVVGEPEEPEDQYTVIELDGEMNAFCAPSPDGDEASISLNTGMVGQLSLPFPVVSHVRFEFIIPTPAEEGVIDPRLQFYSVSEISIIGYCPDNQECPVIVEPGCGVCINQLLLSLIGVQDVVTITLEELPDIVINEETLQRLQDEIAQLQEAVFHLDGTFLTLEVVYGTVSPLPPDAQLPSTVVRIDIQLVPSILEKLDALRDAINMTSQFSFNTSAITTLLSGLSDSLQTLINNATELNSEVNDFIFTLDDIIANLTSQLNITTVARIQANQTTTIILSRQYDNISSEVNTTLFAAVEYFVLAQFYFQQADSNRLDVIVLQDDFEVVEQLLQRVLMLAMDALGNAMMAQNDTAAAYDLIDEIERLLSLAEATNLTSHERVEEVRMLIGNGEVLLEVAVDTTQNITLPLEYLRILVERLQVNVTNIRESINAFFSPDPCRNSTRCTFGQIHSENLHENYTKISIASEPTLTLAEMFLANLMNLGQLFDYSEINETALRAQNISIDVLDQLSRVNTSALLTMAQMVLPRAQMLNNQSQTLLMEANFVSNEANVSKQRSERLESDFSLLQTEAEQLEENVNGIDDFSDISEEALMVAGVARNASARAAEALERVSRVENGSTTVRETIYQTRENVENSTRALDDAESQLSTIDLLLNATRMKGEQLVVNTEEFIGINNRLIDQIDSLIASLEDIHNDVNRINSPVRLATPDADSTTPYLSLQPPPGRSLQDTIQFESLDLFLWPSRDYAAPALIFYAGPVYFPDTEENITSFPKEDYFLITAETSAVGVQWEFEDGRKGVEAAVTIGGISQIHVTRVGSQFEFRFDVSVENRGNPSSMSEVVNNSLLFHTSNRTAFLLGGWPEGAELGDPSNPITLSDYNPFEGQFQQLLFNGQQWGLWNVRSSSAPATDLIGDQEFRKNRLAAENLWHISRAFPSAASTLSFDGDGYLQPTIFGGDSNYGGGGTIQFNLFMRPNDEGDALVMYAYDTVESISMEVAFLGGRRHLLLKRHNLDPPFVFINQTDDAIDAEGHWEILLLYAPGPRAFRINNGETLFPDNGGFFSDLTRTKVWFGGVREDMLEGTYIPELTNGSYFGCIDFFFPNPTPLDPLADPFFSTNYLNSPIQRGFSATCLTTVYTREVGLDGRNYLRYNALTVIQTPNVPSQSVGAGSQVVLSLSFRPVDPNGVILAGLDGVNTVDCVLRGGVLEVGVSNGVERQLLESQGNVTLEVWHYVLLELQVPTNGDSVFRLYLDNTLQDEAIGALPGFRFQIQRETPQDPDNPVIFIGGIDQGVITGIDDVPPFTGCMRDFAYNFEAMAFLNSRLIDRYPPGVTYNSCPFINITREPSLAVRTEPPSPREVCLQAPPVRLEGMPEGMSRIHGGFHRLTELRTSNVIGLLSSSWNLTLQLKYTEDGHVVTIQSQEGHTITLDVVETGSVRLTLQAPDGRQISATSGQVLSRNFTDVTIACTVDGGNLSCVTSLLGLDSPLTVEYAGTYFAPDIPLIFGRHGNGPSLVESFVGCIRGLAINGDSSGFAGVQTSTPCYNNTEPGLGFTGISRIETSGSGLPTGSGIGMVRPDFNVTVTATGSLSLSFKPLGANGLILMLIDSNSQPFLAVGLFNGEVRTSNLQNDSDIISDPSTVCDSGNEMFYNLEVEYNQTHISAAIGNDGIPDVVYQLPFPLTSPVFTIGNIPTNYDIPSTSETFRFLLSEDSSDNLPPGFTGCVTDIRVGGQPLMVDIADVVEDVLLGFCPASG